MTERKKRPRDANQLGKSIVDIATGETEDREPTPEEAGQGPRRRRPRPAWRSQGWKSAGRQHERKSRIPNS